MSRCPNPGCNATQPHLIIRVWVNMLYTLAPQSFPFRDQMLHLLNLKESLALLLDSVVLGSIKECLASCPSEIDCENCQSFHHFHSDSLSFDLLKPLLLPSVVDDISPVFTCMYFPHQEVFPVNNMVVIADCLLKQGEILCNIYIWIWAHSPWKFGLNAVFD